MINRKSTLFDQGLACVALLGFGISNAPFIPEKIRHTLFPFLLLALVADLIVSCYWQAQHSKEDMKREQKDERNQMILERAVWYCHTAEDWLLLGLYAIFGLYLHQYEIAYTMYWILIGRFLFTFCARWWLNRKY